MQENILRESDVVKLFITYTMPSGLLKRERVTLRYMDNSGCYFAGSIPANFTKPKRGSAAECIVYTPDGIYKSQVKYLDCSVSLSEVLYQLSVPKIWTFNQRRNGTRKEIELPLILKFSDDKVVYANTKNLSNGGFSFYTEETLSTVHQRFPAEATIVFPSGLTINFPDGKLTTQVKCLRTKNTDEDHVWGLNYYAFKFLGLTNDEVIILKNFLLRLA